jgi:hypothetical protein
MFDGLPADSPLLKIGPAECTSASYGNRADVRSASIPAGGTVTARAAARMYAALLGEVDGVRLISPERLREGKPRLRRYRRRGDLRRCGCRAGDRQPLTKALKGATNIALAHSELAASGGVEAVLLPAPCIWRMRSAP